MEANTYSLRGAARSLLELVTGTFTSTLNRGYDAAAYSLATTERLVGLCAGAVIGGTQGALVLSKYILESATPAPVRRMLPNLPLLHGMGGKPPGEGQRHKEEAVAEQEAQVIGMGGGYTLNVASAEAFPEPPSPQYVPAQTGGLHEEKPSQEFIESAENGIGAAAMHVPQTPVLGATPTYAPYSPERPGLMESPRAFGERYVGHEVEPLGTELQGAEEPRQDHTSPSRARLEAIAKDTQDLRARTTQKLREAEALPGEEEDVRGRPPSGPLPAVLATMPAAEHYARTSPAPVEHMPPDMITGEEGRPVRPSLSMLPEGLEEVPPSVEGEEEAREGAAARLKGLFAPAPAFITGAAIAAPAMATAGRAAPGTGSVSADAVPAPPSSSVPVMGAEASGLAGPEAADASINYEAVEAARLDGIKGERVAVKRVLLPALGTTTELESTIISEEKVTADVVEQHKQRILEGGTWAAPAAAATGAAAVGSAAAGVGAREVEASGLAGGELAVGEEAPTAGIMKVSPAGLPAKERARSGTAEGIAVEEPAVEAPSAGARDLATAEALEGKPASAAELAGQELGAAAGAKERSPAGALDKEVSAGSAAVETERIAVATPKAGGKHEPEPVSALSSLAAPSTPAPSSEAAVPYGPSGTKLPKPVPELPEEPVPLESSIAAPEGHLGGAKLAPQPETSLAPAGRQAAPVLVPEPKPVAAAPGVADKGAPVKKKKRSRNPFHKLKKMLFTPPPPEAMS